MLSLVVMGREFDDGMVGGSEVVVPVGLGYVHTLRRPTDENV
jgi:hypothetical protein